MNLKEISFVTVMENNTQEVMSCCKNCIKEKNKKKQRKMQTLLSR